MRRFFIISLFSLLFSFFVISCAGSGEDSNNSNNNNATNNNNVTNNNNATNNNNSNNGTCGNGVIDSGETCDGTNLNGATCLSLGYYGGTPLCSVDCGNIDISACKNYGHCGDGIIQDSYGEECDGTNLGSANCTDFGYYDGTISSCKSDCTLDLSGCEDVCLVWDPNGRAHLTIESATFGTGNTWADYTTEFQNLVHNDWLYYHVYRTYIDMGDPAPGENKTLRLTYRLDNNENYREYGESDIVFINVPEQNLSCCDWQLVSAHWGSDRASAIDVTNALRSYILDCVLDYYCFSANGLGGDPAPGQLKHMYVSYSVGGTQQELVCDEEGANNHIHIE